MGGVVRITCLSLLARRLCVGRRWLELPPSSGVGELAGGPLVTLPVHNIWPRSVSGFASSSCIHDSYCLYPKS